MLRRRARRRAFRRARSVAGSQGRRSPANRDPCQWSFRKRASSGCRGALVRHCPDCGAGPRLATSRAACRTAHQPCLRRRLRALGWRGELEREDRDSGARVGRRRTGSASPRFPRPVRRQRARRPQEVRERALGRRARSKPRRVRRRYGGASNADPPPACPEPIEQAINEERWRDEALDRATAALGEEPAPEPEDRVARFVGAHGRATACGAGARGARQQDLGRDPGARR